VPILSVDFILLELQELFFFLLAREEVKLLRRSGVDEWSHRLQVLHQDVLVLLVLLGRTDFVTSRDVPEHTKDICSTIINLIYIS
jgi:hypothetical protein